jgi:hypothetical protein
MFFPEILKELAPYGFTRGVNCFLAVQTSHVGALVLRRYVPANDVLRFFSVLDEAQVSQYGRYVILRDFKELQSDVNLLGDIDVLIDQSMIPFVEHGSQATPQAGHIPIDAQIHEPTTASVLPYWYRPLATDLLRARESAKSFTESFGKTLEAAALAYHMLFHKGPEFYIVAGMNRVERLAKFLNVSPKAWVSPACVFLQSLNYFPPLDMRRAILKRVEGLGGSAPWLRGTCESESSRSDSVKLVCFVRSDEASVLGVIEDSLRDSGVEIEGRHTLTGDVADRVRSGVWAENGQMRLPREALVLDASRFRGDVHESNQEFQGRIPFSVKYLLRIALSGASHAPALIHMPDSDSENIEALAVLEAYGARG